MSVEKLNCSRLLAALELVVFVFCRIVSHSQLTSLPLLSQWLTTRSEEIKDDVDIFVDFENCQPSEEEYDLWLEINEKLAHTDDVLRLVQNYPGAATEIRVAIERYSDANAQLQAWKALCPLVQQLRFCYDFGVELAQTIPRLLNALCSDELTVWEHLESQQALFKQFAEILDFIMKFDDLKMTKPSIQNDFSFFRRLRSRRRVNPPLYQARPLTRLFLDRFCCVCTFCRAIERY
nr:unnamed protein product [Spirometra erinaceieuropaei]